MKATFRLGRIAGVQVGVNWTVLIIFALIAISLSAGRFPDAYPGYQTWAYIVAGIVTALVFFVGLLAHELSHAVVAMRHGIAVEGITLWMLGGVAKLRGEPRTPSADLRIAGVGPLVSLLIGVAFGGLAALMAAAGSTGLVFGTIVWLALINVSLAVFNVLPAAPLDGGRLLRAALWRWRGDRTWAAVSAARAGRVFGAVLIGFGLWQLFAGAGIGGLWLILIGWFVLGAAGMEEAQARLGGALQGVRVADVMSPDPATLRGDTTVAEFVDHHLWNARHTAFPVVEDGRPVGLVTLDHIRRVLPEQRSSSTLREVMGTDAPVLASPQEALTDLLPRLSPETGNRALVVSDGRLVGIVSPTDISRAVQLAALHEREPR